jgi:hypothetical protein
LNGVGACSQSKSKYLSYHIASIVSFKSSTDKANGPQAPGIKPYGQRNSGTGSIIPLKGDLYGVDLKQ